MDFNSVGLSLEAIISTIVYAAIGFIMMIVFFWVFDKLFRLNIKRELIEDDNPAVGILLAGVALSTAIIIAASMIG